MPKIRLPHNWIPRPDQRALWDYLENGGKRAVEVAHRRWGKDDVALHFAACASQQRVGTYWHLLPEASQARKAIWEAINPRTGKRRIDEAFPEAMRSATRENEMFLRFKNGSTWQVVGSDNYNSLVGSPPIGLVFSEWALANPAAWAYLRPILRENGGWALFIYTPRGRNHGATMYEEHKDDPEWFTQKLPATQTPVFKPDDLETEKREYIREFGVVDGESRFRQEYLCDFNVAVIGALFGAEMSEAEDAGRIRHIPHDRAVKVDTWWDLGYEDATAVWFVQHVCGEIHVIDYFEMNHCDLPDLARMLQEKREQRKYIYGRHIWPKDGGNKTQASGGKPLSSLFYDLGFTVAVQPQYDLQVGLSRARQAIPRCYFDRENCRAGIEALRSYRKIWDEEKRVYSAKPLHDWASHGATAFMLGTLAYVEPSAARLVAARRPYEPRRQLPAGRTWMSG